jgi:molybdopterin-binding protein
VIDALNLDVRFPADDPRVEVHSFRVHHGERLVLFGPNGAGKSTLLRVLAGTLGHQATRSSAYLPQSPWMFRGWAGDNLGLGLDAEGSARARLIVDELGIADLAVPARQLSGGEAQRVALARVLARPEPIVLLDEPLAPIDLRDRARIAAVVSRWIGERTAVIVTHDRDNAAILGDAMAVMIDGHIVQRGPVADVFAQPVNEQVADVVGLSNVIVGDVSGRTEGMVAIDAGDLTVWGISGEDGVGPARAMFGAETVTILPAGSEVGSARNRWSGSVKAVRPLGRLLEVVVDAGHPVVALVTPGAAEALDLTIGSDVVISVKATAVRVVIGT